MGIIKQCTYPTHPDPPPRNRTHPHPPTPIQNSFPPTPTTIPEKQNSPPNQNYAPQCQFFKFTGQKAQQFFNYFSKEFFKRVKRVKRVFELLLNIFNFQEYLGNFRKLISRNKEFKFWHLQSFINEKPCQPKTFEVFSMEHVELTEQLFG